LLQLLSLYTICRLLHTYTNTHTHTHTHTNTNTNTHVHARAHTYAHTHIHAHTLTHITSLQDICTLMTAESSIGTGTHSDRIKSSEPRTH